MDAHVQQRVARSRIITALKVTTLLATVWGIWALFFGPTQADSKNNEATAALIIHSVTRGRFENFVTESGEIEGGDNVEVRCEVRSIGGGGTTILKIVPEGTLVKKDQFLIQFDDAAQKIILTQQEILVATDEASVIEVTSELSKAQHSLNEYREGTYRFDKKTYESELFQVQEDLRRSQESLVFTERMVKKGYKPRSQVEAERFAVQKARKDLEAAEIKLSVLTDFTLKKMVGEFEADIEKQKANLKAARFTLKLSQQRRDEIEDQIDKCRVLAPAAGQVVYANDFEKSNNIVIEEGAQIRERQVVVRLPSPDNMQVRSRVNDSKIKQVNVGDIVTIEVDVNPDLPVQGVVSKIEPFPYPRQWYGGPIEYGVSIRILNSPKELTPGQRAKVKILVDQQDDVVQLPIQSTLEFGGKHYCLVRNTEGEWMTRAVSIGPSNGSFVVIRHGVEVGEQVALTPKRDDVFPDDDASEKTGIADSKVNAAATGS